MNVLLLMDKEEHDVSILDVFHETSSNSDLHIHLKNKSNFQLNNFLEPDLVILDIDFFDPASLDTQLDVIYKLPVIFISSHIDSTICSFKYNCIDFILKPITKSLMHKAMLRFHFTNAINDNNIEFDEILRNVNQRKNYKNKFIVNVGSSISTVDADNIPFFYKNGLVFLTDNDGKKYITSYLSLDQVEKELNQNLFYRANRTHIINKKFIDKYMNENDGKISLKLNTPQANNIRISKGKASSFRKWYAV